MSNNESQPEMKNKFRQVVTYKWASIVSLVLAVIFLFVGTIQIISGPSKVAELKADFSNFSADVPTSAKLELAVNTNAEFVRSNRRSSTTYNYFLVKIQNRKFILETTNKDEIKDGKTIFVKDNVSSTGSSNELAIKFLAREGAADNDLKLTKDEAEVIKIIEHYKESDKLAADYWGWIVFAIFIVAAGVMFFKYKSEKNIYEGAYLNTKNSSGEISEFSKENVAVEKSANNQQNSTSTQNVVQNSNFHGVASSGLNYNQAVNSSVETNVNLDAKKSKTTSKTPYILLAIFLGIFGIHHFYKGKILFGILHLVWLFCLIIPLFAIEQLALVFLLSFLLLPVTFVVSLIQALMHGLKKV